MTIGSGLRAPPSTLGSMARSKTPDSTPPATKGKEKVESSKKRKVAFEDVPTSSPPSQPPKPASQPEPIKETATSSAGGSQVNNDEEVLALLRQLPERAGMSAAFIDCFTSDEAWERMKKRSPKVAFSAAMRMLANVSFFSNLVFSTLFRSPRTNHISFFQTAAAAVLMYDSVLESLEKGDKVEETTRSLKDLEKTRESEKESFESEKKQLRENLEKTKLEKEKLEERVKELEKTISEHPDALKKAAEEAGRRAVEDFKASEVKELEEKASDIASSTIIYNIYCEHPEFDFSILGEDVVELVNSWREAEKEAEAVKNATSTGASTSAQ